MYFNQISSLIFLTGVLDAQRNQQAVSCGAISKLNLRLSWTSAFKAPVKNEREFLLNDTAYCFTIR